MVEGSVRRRGKTSEHLFEDIYKIPGRCKNIAIMGISYVVEIAGKGGHSTFPLFSGKSATRIARQSKRVKHAPPHGLGGLWQRAGEPLTAGTQGRT